MKKIILAVAIWLCLCSSALARTRLQGYCDASGVTLTVGGLNVSQPSRVSYPGCTVYVFLTGTTTPVPVIYGDDAGTTKSNPFTADTHTGLWFFYSDAAIVDVRFSGATIPTPITQAANTVTSFGYDVTVNTLQSFSVNVSAGVVMCSGGEASYVGGTLSSLAPSTDNYVFLDSSSSCVPAVNTTGFPTTGIPVAEVFTSGSAITNIISRIGMPTIGGGGGGTVNVNGSAVTNPNFNNTTPAAAAGFENVIFNASGSSVSGQVAIQPPTIAYASLPLYTNGCSGDMGCAIQNALNSLYLVGGGTVDARGFVCPTACHIGQANLTFGDGVNLITAYLPSGTITRDVIPSTGISAQIFYNYGATIIGQGMQATIISGPTDVTAVAQAPVGSVSNAALSEFSIVDTGPIATNSVTLQVGGPAIGGLASPEPPQISYSNNTLQGAGGYQFWAGTSYHYAVFSHALTAAQVAALYMTGSSAGSGYPAAVEALSPMAYWPMTETSGTTMTDVIGTACGGHPCNGTYIGGVTLGSAGGLPGDAGTTSPIFDGFTGNATLPTLNWFPNNDFTVMGWVLPTNGSGMQSVFIFQDASGNNSASFADESSAWGGMYGRIEINGTVYRTIFNRSSIGTGTLTFVVFVQHSGLLSLYLNGVAVRIGGDVSSSTFSNIQTAGADVGVLLNGQDGCLCYNRFYNIKANGRSIGIKSVNNSGYGFGVNSNYWQSPQPGGAVGIYDFGGTVNEYSGVPDLENNLWNSGLNAAVAAEVTNGTGFAGSGYLVGDVITATLGCTVNPTFKVLYTYPGGAGQVGSNVSPTEQALEVVTGGSGCPSGSTDNVATTGGTGTGLRVNVHVSGTAVFLGFATKVGLTYSENGAQIYACGGGNYFEVIGQIGNGSTWKPTLCYGTTNSYGGPGSNWWAAPGSAPPGLGLQGSAPYISYGTGLMYDSLSSYAYTPSMSFPSNLYSNGPTYNGSAAQIYGFWGNNEWNSGVNKPHAGTVATGKTSFGKITDPSAPVLTAIGGTGTPTANYGLVCIDGNGGHTTVTSPSNQVSGGGPSTLGAFLTMTIGAGAATLTGTVTATGTAVTWASGSTFHVGGAWPGETITIAGQPNTVASVGSSTSLTLTAPVANGPFASPVGYSIVDGYSQADVGTNVTVAGFAGFGSGAQATITQVNNGSGSGPVTGISLHAAGSGYVMETFTGSSNPLNRATTGGTGTGLLITGTTTYIQVALPHTNGCLQWDVLVGDTAHALQSPGGYATGSTDLSSYVFDAGNATNSVSWVSTLNTTSDVTVAGIVTAPQYCIGVSCITAWPGSGGSPPFSSLTSGTNTAAAMLVGTGASLGTSGSGTITATTAVNLAASPSLCTTGYAPTGVLANGNATGCAVIGGSSTISVNGSVISSPNFNSSTPSPDSNYTALTFKVSGSNVIAEGILPATKTAVTSNWINSYNGATGAFTQTQPVLSDISATYTAPLVLTSNTLSCNVASGSQPGCLASADWTAFNGKQASLSTNSGSTHKWFSSFTSPNTFGLTQPTLTDVAAGVAPSGTFDFSGVTILKARVGSGLTASVNGDFGYDTSNGNWHFYANGGDGYLFGGPASGTYTNGHCVQFSNSSGVLTLIDSGSANCGGGGSILWNNISNPSGNFSPAMAGYTSTFTFTSALPDAFQWYNSTAATSGTSASGPILDLSCGNEWHAAASTLGCVSLQFVPGNGTDAASTATFTHTGSATGSMGVSFPGSLSAKAGSLTSLSLTNQLTVPNGGTGDVTFTAHGVLLGESTSAIAVTAAGAVNTVLLGEGPSSDPQFGAVPNAALSNSTIGVSGTSNQITSSGSPISLGGSTTLAIANPFTFPGKWTGAASTTSAATANIPSGSAPTSPSSGDIWNLSGILQFYDGTHTNSLTTIQSAPTSGVIPIYSGTGGLLGSYAGASTCTGAAVVQTITASGGVTCITPSGSGNVSTSGSPAQYQTAVWVTGTTITGVGPGTTGYPLVSAGASANPAYAILAPNGGGFGIASPTANSLIVAEGSSNVNLVTSPTVNGFYGCGFNVTASAKVDPTCVLQGVPVDASNPSTLLYSDRASYLNWTSGTALALPSTTGQFASNLPFVIQNTSTTLTITPNAGASNQIDSASSGTLIPNFAAFVYQDSGSPPAWWTIKFPTFAAFGSTCADPIAWSTTTGFSCLSLTSGGIPYGSGSNTWASSAALTHYGVVYGGGAGGAPVATAAGAVNTVLLGEGASAAPQFGTVGNSALTNSSLTVNGVTIALGASGSVGSLYDTNGNSSVTTGTIASAVDFLTVTDAATGSPAVVKLSGGGTDNGVGLLVQGKDVSANAILGSVTLRGGNETGAGGSTSKGGSVLVAGGSNAATNTSSVAGTVEVAAGASTGATTGLQGLSLDLESYAQTGTVTQWNLECFTSTAKTVNDCGASPTNIAGVAFSKSGSVQVSVAQTPSEVPINASAAVTVGHTVCAASTAGQVTDSGGTSPCTSGLTIGTVIAISGTWPSFPDGTSFPSLSSTLPLVAMRNNATATTIDGTTCAPGAVCTVGVTSLTGDGTIITNSLSTGAVTLSIAGTSGGIPYFSSSSAWHSSGVMAANQPIVGGGAGAAPVSGYAIASGSGTSGALACVTSSGTMGNCTATPPNNVIGVFNSTSTYIPEGITSVLLDATQNVTDGDILCASVTGAHEAHDNGSTACTTQTIGTVTTTASSVSSATASLQIGGMLNLPEIMYTQYGPVDASFATDDTAAWQAALNACASPGCTIVVPAGQYKITSTLTHSGEGLNIRAVGTSGGGPGTGGPQLASVQLGCYTASIVVLKLGTLSTANYQGPHLHNLTFIDKTASNNCGGSVEMINQSYSLLEDMTYQGFTLAATTAPTTPALTPSTSGGSLANATYYVSIADADSIAHETAKSTAVSSAVGGTGSGSIALASHTPTSPMTCFNVYAGSSATTMHMIAQCQAAGTYTITALANSNLSPTSFDESASYAVNSFGTAGIPGALAGGYSNQNIFRNNQVENGGTINGIVADRNNSATYVEEGNFNGGSNTSGCILGIFQYAFVTTHTEAGGSGSQRACIDGYQGEMHIGLDLLTTGESGIVGIGANKWKITSIVSVGSGTPVAVNLDANSGNNWVEKFGTGGSTITNSGANNTILDDEATNYVFGQPISASTLISTVSTGTAPFTVSSTTQVANLNAATLGGINLGTPVAGGIGYGVSTTQIGTTSALTQYGVLFSGGTGAPTSSAQGASGIPLIGQGAANPIFGTAIVGGGGTGDTTFTAYAPVVGGTTTTGNLQSTAVGTAKQIFVSGGIGAVPNYIDLPDVKIVPAANCVNAVAGSGWNTALTPACIGGSNNLGGYLPFVDASVAQFEYELPADWDTGSQPYIAVHFLSNSNTSGTVIFQAAVACYKSDGSTTSDPSFNTADVMTTKTMATATRGWSTSVQSTQVTSGNSCVPGGTMLVKITRNTDTAAAAVWVTKAVITTPRLLTVQAN